MTKISPLLMVPPLLFVGLAAMFMWGMNRGDPDALPSTREGAPVPVLELTQLGVHEPFGTEDLQQPGIKLVNFWASWCGPCRAEHPNLEALAAEGIKIYGINYKDDPKKALAFLTSLGDPYTRIAADEKGRNALEWGVYGVPETYVIDSDGIVVLRFAGPITQRVLRETIRPAMQAAN
ncbi:MAG: DsbE family thiol:disulfide interchange protein [Paracoccaceae bacterium]